jgi:hypothetical protein
MLLKEIADPIPAVSRLMSQIEFTVYPQETDAIVKVLQLRQIKPTLRNIQRYLLKCLLTPLDELPPVERKIILRSGRPERFE